MNTRLAVLVLFISSIGWGLTWLPIKYLNDMGLDSTYLILIAFSSGAIVLLPWLIKQSQHWKSSLGLMLGIALALSSKFGLLAVVVFFIPAVLYRVAAEEKLLIDKFGKEYLGYMEKTNKLIPFIY